VTVPNAVGVKTALNVALEPAATVTGIVRPRVNTREYTKTVLFNLNTQRTTDPDDPAGSCMQDLRGAVDPETTAAAKQMN
jgi:hypothetical protein